MKFKFQKIILIFMLLCSQNMKICSSLDTTAFLQMSKEQRKALLEKAREDRRKRSSRRFSTKGSSNNKKNLENTPKKIQAPAQKVATLDQADEVSLESKKLFQPGETLAQADKISLKSDELETPVQTAEVSLKGEELVKKDLFKNVSKETIKSLLDKYGVESITEIDGKKYGVDIMGSLQEIAELNENESEKKKFN